MSVARTLLVYLTALVLIIKLMKGASALRQVSSLVLRIQRTLQASPLPQLLPSGPPSGPVGALGAPSPRGPVIGDGAKGTRGRRLGWGRPGPIGSRGGSGVAWGYQVDEGCFSFTPSIFTGAENPKDPASLTPTQLNHAVTFQVWKVVCFCSFPKNALLLRLLLEKCQKQITFPQSFFPTLDLDF